MTWIEELHKETFYLRSRINSLVLENEQLKAENQKLKKNLELIGISEEVYSKTKKDLKLKRG